MVVISNTLVGCDIQFMKEDAISLADRYFTKEEIDEINASDDKVSTFYKLWTLKESYRKGVGGGLAIPLDLFSVLEGREPEGYSLHSFVHSDGYRYSCTAKKCASEISFVSKWLKTE